MEQAFELSDAICRTLRRWLHGDDKEPIIEYLNSNITLLKWMIVNGYQDAKTLERRIKGMEEWLANPTA